MSASPATATGLSLHRIDALTDGIYAVAMTLLVIELKLPESLPAHSDTAMVEALVGLLPKIFAWVVSFGVMALFWMGHHRIHGYLRHVDGPLVALNIGQLACVSLMPFSCALQGEHGGLVPQVVFAANMAMMAVFALALARRVFHHPELCAHPMSLGAYRGARFRVSGLIAVSALTVAIQSFTPPGWYGFNNIAFALMAILGRVSRWIERTAPAAPAALSPAR